MLKLWQRSLFITGVFSIWVVPSAFAEVATNSKKLPFAKIIGVNDLPRGATTVKERLSQRQTVVSVMAVKANPTDKGVEVILQTTQGEQLQITNRSAGNNFIVDIPNAQLRLPSGDAFTFSSEKPLAGISEITVTNFDANTIRVTVTGETGLPSVELFDSDEGLIFGVANAASSAQQPQPQPPASVTQPEKPSDQPIELVVTGEQDGYSVRDSSTGTRTDTPLRDIPQSIQIVPQQVIKDQQAVRLEDALRNVTGVTSAASPGSIRSQFNIRGYGVSEFSGNYLRDGLRGCLKSCKVYSKPLSKPLPETERGFETPIPL